MNTASVFHRALPAALVALAALASPAARAQVVNGDFGAGLAGWSSAGDASTRAASGADPARLFLTTASVAYADDFDAGLAAGARSASGTPAADVGALEAFVGVPGYGLDTAQGGATEGSAAQQLVDAAAGSTLSFRWDLGTLDTSADPALADAAWIVIDGHATLLGTSLAATAPGSDGNAVQTGWLDFSTTFASAGPHSVSFVIVDIGDYDATSTLAVADLALGVGAVPETSTLALMLCGLTLLAVAQQRRRD